jgi:hypothetical protein
VDGVLGDPGLDQPLQRLERVEVRVAEELLVGVGTRQPQRLPLPREELDGQVDLLGQLPGRVLGLAAQRELDRQQGEVAPFDRALQLVERDVLVVQLLQELEPGAPLVALEPLEQALRLEVDVRDR